MTQKLKSIFLTFATLSFALVPALAASSVAVVSADTVDIGNNLCAGTNLDATGADTSGCNDTTTGNLNGLLARVINIFSLIVGVIAVVMIIVGGLRYITSGGDSNKVGAAKTTIIYALVGLVVVALAQLIVHFVLTQTNNVITGA